MYKASVVLALSALASIVSAQVPSCAQSCITLPSQCNGNPSCICTDQTWLQTLTCCVKANCDQSDQQAALQYANTVCNPVSITLNPSAFAQATCTGNSTATATGSSTLTGSAASSISSLSSSAASVASSASSKASAASSSAASSASAVSSKAASSASSASSSSASASSSSGPGERLAANGMGVVAAMLGAAAVL